MFVADDVLEPVPRLVVVPAVLAEELLLQGVGQQAGIDRDRLDALLGDVGELAGDDRVSILPNNGDNTFQARQGFGTWTGPLDRNFLSESPAGLCMMG